jgi:hypothetical protein
MKLSPHSLYGALLLSAQLASSPSAWSASVQVMLFGQPCQLEGPSPLTEIQLKAIHNIGPEQTLISESVPTLQTSLERLSQKADIPEPFAKYIERRTKAVQSRLSFEDGLQKARKSRSPEAFSLAIKALVHPRRLKGMEKHFERALKAGNSPSAWEQIRSEFSDIAGPDGEEDFHRARRKLKINYHCTFESFDDEQHPPGAGSEPVSPPASGSSH